MTRRERPSIEDMDDGVQHSYDHRGDTGKYGNIYKEEVEQWRKLGEMDHEFCMVPYLCKENSVFRTKNPDFNKPFDDEKIQSEAAWAHKLTVLIHNNIGVNKDAVICLRTLKEECPICEDRERLFTLIDQESDKDKAKQLQERADKLGTSKKALYNVVVFDSDKEMRKGVQIWEAPHASIEDVLSELYTDRRTGEKKYYTIPEEGWNVCFEKRGKGLNTEYRKVAIERRRKEDALSDKDLDELYAMAYNLDEIVEIKDYKVLYTIHHGTEGLPEKEERPDQGSRFRGRREEKAADSLADERDTGRRAPEEVPEKYTECFGIMNGQKEECEECPKKIWEKCLKKTDENKKEVRKEPERKFRRGLD